MIYLDNSATTKPSASAIKAATDMFENFGNPSALHEVGARAQAVLEDARSEIARVISAKVEEIVFTSGGTEANNTAVIMPALARRKRGNRVVVSAVEHDSVMASAKYLENQGFDVVYVYPEKDGSITAEAFERAIDQNTVLVSCMLVNNETGAIFPCEKLRSIVKKANSPALIHVDAVQALGKIPVSVKRLDCDMLSFSAHKIHGLKGSGALYISQEAQKLMKFYPYLKGGHQENGLRAGTEATVNIAAFGAACRELDVSRDGAKIRQVRDAFARELSLIKEVIINSPEKSAPHILNFSVPGYKSETLLHAFEQKGIYVSSGSACKKGEKSHVLKAQGLPDEITDSTVRVSLSKENTEEEARIFCDALREIIGSVVHIKVRSDIFERNA